MSAGNYGKAFAFIAAATVAAAERDNVNPMIGRRIVVMPASAPPDRKTAIEVCLPTFSE
jgi:hypothetical protein